MLVSLDTGAGILVPQQAMRKPFSMAQNPHRPFSTMAADRSDEDRESFELLSNEYAQALQAFKAIENQSATLMLLGCSDDLREFVDQFIEMASRAKAMAEEKQEPNFVEWFTELIAKAEELRGAIPTTKG